MKTIRTLIIATTLLFSFLLYSQSTTQIYQLSDGGIPWSSKFTQYDRDIPYVIMPGFDVASYMREDSINQHIKNIPYRFGHNYHVSYNLNNSGNWKTLDDGGRIWRLGISCPGALSINLAFQYVSIPEGGKLFVFNADKSIVLGAFTQKHISPDYQLGTELIDGDSIIVEYYEPANALGQSMLEIFRITHRYRGLDEYFSKAFGDSGPCMNNVRCPAYAAYDNQIRSVVCLVSGGNGFCTGALINNTCNDGKPYVLTANHCGSSGFGSWVFRFNWEAPGCSNPPTSPSTAQSISGSTSRANYAGSDMRLVEINSAVPASYNAYWAGWDRTNTAPVNPYGIHHPSGDIKKISFSTGTATTSSMSGATTWRTPTWTDGVTEPGSSGSPLFNSAGLIVGQLYGGPSNCSLEGNPSGGYDEYGKLFTSWTGGGTNSTRLSNWLAPASCSATAPNTLNGYDPNMPSLALDAQLQSIVTPGATECSGTNITPVVVLKNNGTTVLTSATISYSIDGGAAVNYSWSGNLASNASTNVTLAPFSVGAGAHTITVTVSSPNGGTDLNTSNDSQTRNFTVVNPTGVALPFTEGFEGATFPPTNWLNENPDNNTGSALWVRTTAASGFGNSTACARIDHASPTSSTAGQVDNLITPYINLSTAGGPCELSFSVANARYNATYYDSLIVSITTDCGNSWIRLASYGNNTGPSPLATAPDVTSAFVPTSSQWATKTIDLSTYASQTAVRIRFQLRSGWGNITYLDDINISAISSTPPTASFSASSNSICSGQSVTFTNTSTNATSYSWSLPGGTPSTSSATSPTVTYNAAGTYTVTLTATNSNGTSTSTATIVVNPSPTPSISGGGTICQGSSATLTATGGNSYAWSTTATTNAITVSPSSNTTYTVTATASNGCTATATASVTVVNCSSLDEVMNASNFIIYPNPATAMINISLQQASAQPLVGQLMTTLGQVLKQFTILPSQQQITIITDGLASGIYLLRISDGKQAITQRIMVVK
ncbi:MAG: PKD domain-containing protein [Flavobacteriales bacterium]|nr:PKD domain-containing protein [Flavobacteriales bacterium]